jgi:hypothetical protein
MGYFLLVSHLTWPGLAVVAAMSACQHRSYQLLQARLAWRQRAAATGEPIDYHAPLPQRLYLMQLVVGGGMLLLVAGLLVVVTRPHQAQAWAGFVVLAVAVVQEAWPDSAAFLRRG